MVCDTTTNSSAPPKTVLIVEDDSAIQMGLSMVLRRAGLDVLLAANGREGLEKITSDRPDLVITDIRMPEMDGLEMLAEVKSRPDIKDTLVMVLSASPGDQSKSLDTGACQFARKPFSHRSIVQSVYRILDLPSPEDTSRHQPGAPRATSPPSPLRSLPS